MKRTRKPRRKKIRESLINVVKNGEEVCALYEQICNNFIQKKKRITKHAFPNKHTQNTATVNKERWVKKKHHYDPKISF